jgi:hypothetical protein
MTRVVLSLAALALLGGACRGPEPGDTGPEAVARLVDSLSPAVEKAVGLKFTHRPMSTVRSRDQIRSYVVHKLDAELPASKARGLQAAYRLLGLFPDTLELRPLLLDLYTEQIVGFYEPDSSTLFVAANADPKILRVVVAHELVHALQHQYTPIDSIMRQQGDNDRLAAATAILEGQATLGGLQVMVPEQNLYAMPEFWETYRSKLQSEQATMPVFSRAPRILRESLIFPYLAGADFLRWWAGSERRDSMPYGARMPVSTEQVLHPYRYGRGDVPVTLAFNEQNDGALYEDVFGEFDIRVLNAELSKSVEVTTPIAIGWGGDRFRVYDTPDGAALVWYSVWDDQSARSRFISNTADRLQRQRPLGYRLETTTPMIDGHPGVRLVLAPVRWPVWDHLPTVHVVNPS